MALPVINFPSTQTPDLSNLGNLFGNVQKGFEASQAPQRAAEEYIQRMLQNQLLRMQTKQAEQDVSIMDMALGRLGMGGSGTPNMGAQQQMGGAGGAPQSMGGAMPSGMGGGGQGMFANGVPQSAVLDAILTKRLTGGTDTFDDKVQVLPSGEVLFYNPKTGKMDVRQLGSALEEVEARKTSAVERAKRNAEYVNKLEDSISSERSKRPIFNELATVLNSPEFLFGAGTVSSKLAQFTGDPKVNQALATVDSALGELVNRASTQFGKNLNRSEYEALQRMKGNTSQNPYALKAKVDLASALSKHKEQVDSLTLDYVDQGLSRTQAEKLAYEQVDYFEVKDIIRTDNAAHKIANKTRAKYEDILSAAYRVQKETGQPLSEILEGFK